jgi:hypothetical protein
MPIKFILTGKLRVILNQLGLEFYYKEEKKVCGNSNPKA